jgi:hypothetical protein
MPTERLSMRRIREVLRLKHQGPDRARHRAYMATCVAPALIVRLANTPRDRTDVNVTVVDVPAVLAFGKAAASEFGMTH